MKILELIPADKRWVTALAAVIIAVYLIVWLMDRGWMESQIVNKAYVDNGDNKVQTALVSQLNVIEAQGIERQLTNVANHRCNTQEERFDGVWNSLRERYKEKAGKDYVFKDCAR